MKRKLLSILLTLSLVFSLLPTVALADETSTIDLDTFIKNVVAAEYNYDGQGITVRWSPVSGCFDAREGHTCTVNNVPATGNTPKRVNSGLTQFQLFEGQSVNVTVKNVKFVYEPAAFTVCENSGWKGSFTANQAPAGQLYFMTTGDVTFEGCEFDHAVLTMFNTTGASTVKNCKFANVYNSYAIKDIRGANISVTGTTVENCGGGIMVSSTGTVSNVTITGNTFTNVDVAGTAAEGKVGTRAILQVASSGTYTDTKFELSGNTASDCGPVLRQLNENAKSGITAQTDSLQTLVSSGSTLYTTDSKRPYAAETKDGTTYDTLADALIAVSAANPLTWVSDTAWNKAEPVYWQAGGQSGYAATLKTAMEAACTENADKITIICRPNTVISKSPAHINVTCDTTVYANGVDFGGNDLSIGTYAAPKSNTTTVNIYDAKNLVVWGQPVDDRADVWNVNFFDCVNDGNNFLMYRGSESGKAAINATLTDCKATGFKDSIIHTTADGSITIKNCEFANNCAPVNIAHKQTGTMQVTIENSSFTNCGKESTDNYFAPVRIVNNNSAGTVNTTVDGCTFAGTVGTNGDILIGDGRSGKESHDVSLTVKNTAANVQAQQSGYYAEDGTVSDAGKVSKTAVEKSAEETTITNKAEEFIVAQIGDKKYSTLAEAIEEASANDTITLLKDVELTSTLDLAKNITIDGQGRYTIKAADDFIVGSDNKTCCVLYT